MRSLLLSLALTCAVTSVASAQDFDAAGKHFSAAQEAFGARHFKAAATEFDAAYAITKDPVLLYNLAESYEKAGDGRKAVAAYKQYLHEQASAQDKAEVQRRIRAIEIKKFKLVDQSLPGDNPSDTGAATTAPLPVTPSGPPATPAPAAGSTAPSGSATANAGSSSAPSAGSAGAGSSLTPPSTAAPTATLPSSTLPATSALPPTTAPAPESAATPEKAATAPTEPSAAAATAEKAAPEPPAPGLIDEGPASKLRVAAWIGVATTLALLTAGAIFGLAAQSRSDEINRRLTFVGMDGQPHKYDGGADSELAQLKSDGELYNGLGIGFYSAAAASAVATVVMFVVDAKRPKPASHAWRAAPLVGGGTAGISLGGTF